MHSLDDFEPSYGTLKKIKVSNYNFDWKFSSKLKQIFHYHKTSLFFGIAITWLKITQTLQVRGVLESLGNPLDDEHRDFQD